MADPIEPNSEGDSSGYEDGERLGDQGSLYSFRHGDANDSEVLASSPDVSSMKTAAQSKIKSEKHRMKLEQRKQIQMQKKMNKPAKGSSRNKEKIENKQKLRLESAKAAFTAHYAKQFGDRWPKLYQALLQPTQHCALINRYCLESYINESLSNIRSELAQLDFIGVPCLAFKPDSPNANQESPYPAPSRDPSGMINYYLLDAGSLLAVEVLDVQPTDCVLDICAAPGGKSLAILQRLDLAKGGSLTCNELSPDRRKRLKTVIQSYVPSHLRPYVTISSRDATRWHLLESTKFDKILVDAPCSSDRHVLRDEEELASWTPARVRANSKRQFAILSSAVKAVREGGLLVYATCALSEAENDSVVEKVIHKTRAKISVLRKPLPIGEPTKYGWIVLPDSSANSQESTVSSASRITGWGPLYFAILRVDGFPELTDLRNKRRDSSGTTDEPGSDNESDNNADTESSEEHGIPNTTRSRHFDYAPSDH